MVIDGKSKTMRVKCVADMVTLYHQYHLVNLTLLSHLLAKRPLQLKSE